jgi:hypothetical protein
MAKGVELGLTSESLVVFDLHQEELNQNQIY